MKDAPADLVPEHSDEADLGSAMTTLEALGQAPRRVRKAYEQVADQLRALIIGGQLRPGDRLPTESALASQFGVSRPTVREGLRILAAQRLIVTTKGPNGGTFIAVPQLDFISTFLHENLSLLTEMHHISLDELLEAREHLEVQGARLAATRRTTDDLLRLRESVPSTDRAMPKLERFGFNINFHALLMELCGNRLLYISALPIFSVLQTNLARGDLPDKWHKEVTRHHETITAAVEAQDEAAAAVEMRKHIEFLRPAYEQAWHKNRNQLPTAR